MLTLYLYIDTFFSFFLYENGGKPLICCREGFRIFLPRCKSLLTAVVSDCGKPLRLGTVMYAVEMVLSDILTVKMTFSGIF